MTKLIPFFCITCASAIVFPFTASADVISFMSSDVEMTASGTVLVKETIVYDFGDEPRHGIYRNIPTSMTTQDGDHTIAIGNVSVADETGKERVFVVSGTDPVKIKIGDPDVVISGEQVYVLEYTADSAVTFFDDKDELYWNVIGNEWDADIASSTVHFILPAAIDPQFVSRSCYVGAYGSTQLCDDALTSLSVIDGRTILSYSIGRPLRKLEGMTVAVGIPKGYVVEPSSMQRLLRSLMKDIFAGIAILIPLLTFAYVVRTWLRSGRDPKGRGTIIPEYDPPSGLSPMEAGAVQDERISSKDLVAEIIYLAEQGYYTIHRLEEKVLGLFASTDYELVRTSKELHGLKPFQIFIMTGLFGGNGKKVKLSSLKGSFAKHVRGIHSGLFTGVTEAGYFAGDPKKMRERYIGIGVVVIVLGQFAGGFSGLFPFSAMVTGALLVIGGFILPAKTAHGVLVKEHMKGLKMYIDTAEKDRIAFHNAPEKNPGLFEKLLPYAIVFGLEKKWAEEFDDILMQDPSWYQGGTQHAFSASGFVSDMNGLSTFMANAAGHSGGASGGGGFSGGGGGGGGGGSW